MITANCIVLLSITMSLREKSIKYNTNPLTHRDRIRIATVFAVLLGLTWSFGFLVVANNVIIFQYLFCILNSLQGFYIFIFYFIRNEYIRRLWKSKIQGQQRMTQSLMMNSNRSRKTSLDQSSRKNSTSKVEQSRKLSTSLISKV